MSSKSEMPLNAEHTWRAREACKIFVAGRGAVRFEYPALWTVEPGETGVRFHDAPPPDDDHRLEVSYMHIPTTAGDPTPAELIDAVTADTGGAERGPIMRVNRGDLALAWVELRFIDGGSQRSARSRTCIASRGSVRCVITFDFWEDDAASCEETWAIVIGSLRLDEPIDNPSAGPIDG